MNLIIDYSNENDFETGFDFQNDAKLVISKALQNHNIDFDISVSLSLVTEEEIKECNDSFRNISSVTDVLSFPNLNFNDPGIIDKLPDAGDIDYFEYFNPDDGYLYLGDIIICFNRALQQSEEYGHSLRRELLFLVAHSILHLLGYDHMNDEERLVMEDKQRQILNELNITR